MTRLNLQPMHDDLRHDYDKWRVLLIFSPDGGIEE